MGRIERGGVPVQNAGLLMEARACEPSDPGAVAAVRTSTLHCMVVVSHSLM